MAISLLNAGPATVVAEPTDLPYRLVEPGVWEFSGLSGEEIGTEMVFAEGYWILYLSYEGGETDSAGPVSGAASDIVVEFTEKNITATRASLPGHLCDRRSNKITASSATTLTHPSALGGGRLRDFIVRLTIPSGTTLTGLITFADPTGETITYETDGDEFPVPDDVGKWLYAFTETDDGVFDVSLKKVNTVAQGGS